jgi:hypothetical protein
VTLREAGFYIASAARLEVEPAGAEAIGTAWCQGRLDPQLADRAGVPTGRYICMTCGARSWTYRQALVCCSPEGWLPDRPTPAELARLAQLLGRVRTRYSLRSPPVRHE